MLKDFYELSKEAFGPFFPTPRKKREEFLDRVREKVEFYKPKIEERCNLTLGVVKVKDNREWRDDIFYGTNGVAWKRSIEEAWKSGRAPNRIDFMLGYSTAGMAELIMRFPLFLYNTFSGPLMRHHNNTLYVPFYYANRFMDIDFKRRTELLDYSVVHELSHSVWDELAGNEDHLHDGGRIWFEGFATYCAESYFADLYPEGTEKHSNLPKLYLNGKGKIEELVASHGEDIILEIPSKWKSFK